MAALKFVRAVNPATGVAFGEQFAAATSQDISAAFTKARASQRAWAAVPVAQRAATLLAFNKLLLRDRESLASILTSEMGKPINFAKGEVSGTINRVKWIAENAEEASRPWMSKCGTESIEQACD